MSAGDHTLPPGFEALEGFVAGWAIDGTSDRARRRRESSEAERRAFFEGARDRVAPALTHLDRKPLAELDAAEHRLMNLLLSFAHVALAVETQEDDEPQLAELSQHLRITCASADLDPAQSSG